MNIVVLGSDGQLGADVVQALRRHGETCFAATRSDADVTDRARLELLLEREGPDAVVNCTAFHDVSACETNPELAVEVNAVAVRHIADVCSRLRAKFMTISTDYVFDGTRLEGYSEADAPNPRTWYGKSKLAGEWLAAACCPRSFVVRTQSLYGSRAPAGKGQNFVDLMLRLASERRELKVDQCRMAPTWTLPLAENMAALLRTEHYGLYHMSCNGATTWYGFARRIMELTGNTIPVVPVANDYYPKPFARPENTYLINGELAKLQLDQMPQWDTALAAFLESKGHRHPDTERSSA
jgi:dTDP-4-dehydrorhamnose reductase